MSKYSQQKVRDFLSRTDNASTSDEKGDIFEDLVIYIFNKIPGVNFESKNILNRTHSRELDLAFWNEQPNSSLFFLDPILIIECKNHSTPVGSSDVSWFADKLRNAGANSGILFSSSGITGSRDGTSSAHSIVLDVFTRDQILLLIISREELLSLNTTDDLKNLMRYKYTSLKLKQTVS